METYNGVGLSGIGPTDDDNVSLSVAEMIGFLRAIEQNLADDPCLMDLAPEVIDLRLELERRREVAVLVAAEVDAENCRNPN